MNHSRAVDAGVSAGVILIVGALAGGWYGIERAVPTPQTPVADQVFRVGAPSTDGVEFRAPQGWDRVPTGRADVLRFVDRTGSNLSVRLTTGMTDFDTAAPRRLREFEVGGVDAHFTGSIRGPQFNGRTCQASGDGRTGECAVVAHEHLLVTVLNLRAPGQTQADIAALVRTLKQS